jgi:hypothetical protein
VRASPEHPGTGASIDDVRAGVPRVDRGRIVRSSGRAAGDSGVTSA